MSYSDDTSEHGFEASSIPESVIKARWDDSQDEVDDFVPSAAPEPMSVTVSLYTASNTEYDDFVPSAVPEPASISVPLLRSSAESTHSSMDDTVPSDTPGPTSIMTPLYRKSLEDTEKTCVDTSPSAAPLGSVPESLERLSSHIPQYGLDNYGHSLETSSAAAPFQNPPVTSSSTDYGGFVRSAAEGATALNATTDRVDDDLVRSPAGISNFAIAKGKSFFHSAKEFDNSVIVARTDKM